MKKSPAPTGNDWRLHIVQYEDLERTDHRELLDAMFGTRQEIASVLVLNFLPRQVCRDALGAIGTVGFESTVNPIKSDNGRPVERIGPNQSRFSADKPGYFEAQHASSPKLQAIADAMRMDIVDRLKVVMSGLFGKRLVRAREDGKNLNPYVFRHLLRAQPHVDFVPRESPDWAFAQDGIEQQIGWTSTLQAPVQGGETVIAQSSLLTEKDQRPRHPPTVTVTRQEGDLLVIPTVNLHWVNDVHGTAAPSPEGTERRINVGGFIGVRNIKKNVDWTMWG